MRVVFMPTPIKEILSLHINSQIIEQWAEDSVELAFFDKFLPKEARDNLSQAVIEKLKLYITFFLGESFLAIKASHLCYINSVELRKSLHPIIINLILATNLSKPKRDIRLLTKIAIEIDKYFIKIFRSHEIAQAYFRKIRNSEETPFSLAVKVAEAVNILIKNFLQAEKAPFQWPVKPNDILTNVICQLTNANIISLNQLAKLDAESIRKLEHPIVKSYLLYLLSLDRKIPPLKDIFSLNYHQLELFPLVANHALTLEQANAFPIYSAGRTIIHKFVFTADWNNTFDIRRLIFIKSFIESDLFIKFEKSCGILDGEINFLRIQYSNIITKSGIHKSIELRDLKDELIEIVASHLTTLYQPEAIKQELEEKHPFAKSIDIDEEAFKTRLNQDIHTKLHVFIKEKSVSEHRNYFSKILKKILDTLTWLVNPLLNEEYRYRLFRPRSALKIYSIEDDYKISPPRPGSAA
jgi:hypothetical protein